MPELNAAQSGMQWIIAKLLYRLILRRLIKKAIDDPKEVWDDKTMALLDQIFEL